MLVTEPLSEAGERKERGQPAEAGVEDAYGS